MSGIRVDFGDLDNLEEETRHLQEDGRILPPLEYYERVLKLLKAARWVQENVAIVDDFNKPIMPDTFARLKDDTDES